MRFNISSMIINVCIHDLLFGIGDLDITSFADDNTLYTFSSELEVGFEWFHNNLLE